MKFDQSGLAALTCISAALIAVAVRAGGDKVAFPENFSQGVKFTTIDRAYTKQFHELFTSSDVPLILSLTRSGDSCS